MEPHGLLVQRGVTLGYRATHRLHEKYPMICMDKTSKTHTIGSLYKAFDPVETQRLAERLEIHYTSPLHA